MGKALLVLLVLLLLLLLAVGKVLFEADSRDRFLNESGPERS